jgi:Domain of unknown function (DUF1990)
MDWLFRWVTSEADLARWEKRPFSTHVEKGPRLHDNHDNHERVIGREAAGLPENHGIARWLAEAILRFDVFPPNLLTRVLRRTPLEVGDTVGLRYHFVPGLDLLFAARVIARFEDVANDQWRCGFTYRTLDGHPECGEETFIVEKDLATGKVTVALRSWSRPGLWIAKLTYPFVRGLQLGAGRAALDHLEWLAHPIEMQTAHVSPAGRPLIPRRNLRTGLMRSDERW